MHLPWVVIHNIKSTHVGSCHLEAFQDLSMYKEKKVGLGIDTWDETPCRRGPVWSTDLDLATYLRLTDLKIFYIFSHTPYIPNSYPVA